MIEMFALAGVCVLIGLMGRDARERVIVSIVIGGVVAPIGFMLVELWHSEHSGPQMFLEVVTYASIYWRMILAFTAVLIAGSLLVGLTRRYVVKETS